MKNIQNPQFIIKQIHRAITCWLKVKLSLPKNTNIQDGLALLIVVPLVMTYLGFALKALFMVTTCTELTQVAQTLLPISFTIISLILGYYFKKDRDRDGGNDA